MRILPHYDLCVVDEWHDVNAAEFELIQVMAQHARLVVVGDRDQIINSERGADPAFSSNGFDFAFPGARRLSILALVGLIVLITVLVSARYLSRPVIIPMCSIILQDAHVRALELDEVAISRDHSWQQKV